MSSTRYLLGKTSKNKNKSKLKKLGSSGESIFNIAARNRFKDFEDGARRLSKAFSFRNIPVEEPGLYCKYPRITLITKKNDALNTISAAELIQHMKDRANSESKPPMWVDIQGTHDEMKDIAEAFNLHPLTLEECITYDTREKVSIANDYIFLITHDISLPGDRGVNLNMIIFPDLLLTVHEKPVHSIYDVVLKLEHCYDTEIPSIEFIVYVILSSVISFYEPCVDQVRQKVDVLEDEVYQAKVDKQQMSDLLGRLNTGLKASGSLRDNIAIKADVLGSVVRYEEYFTPKGLEYIKGAHDQILKMDMQIGLFHDMLSDINELYMAKISAQLAVVANDVGVISRQFAVISASFLPATLISGILGMNVKLPSLADPLKDDIAPFVYIMVVMLGLCLIQLYLYRKMKWL